MEQMQSKTIKEEVHFGLCLCSTEPDGLHHGRAQLERHTTAVREARDQNVPDEEPNTPVLFRKKQVSFWLCGLFASDSWELQESLQRRIRLYKRRDFVCSQWKLVYLRHKSPCPDLEGPELLFVSFGYRPTYWTSFFGFDLWFLDEKWAGSTHSWQPSWKKRAKRGWWLQMDTCWSTTRPVWMRRRSSFE